VLIFTTTEPLVGQGEKAPGGNETETLQSKSRNGRSTQCLRRALWLGKGEMEVFSFINGRGTLHRKERVKTKRIKTAKSGRLWKMKTKATKSKKVPETLFGNGQCPDLINRQACAELPVDLLGGVKGQCTAQLELNSRAQEMRE